jgi:hypothetical protein
LAPGGLPHELRSRSKLPFAPAQIQFENVRAEPWVTPEGISVAPVYRASDIAGLDCLESFSGWAILSRRLGRRAFPGMDYPTPFKKFRQRHLKLSHRRARRRD